jgi:hypothetical protein
MCLVQNPYYHLCGHYGRQVVAPNGRCARADHAPGPCWEPEDIGVTTIESMCINCGRTVKISETRQLETSRVGPVDCNKFNQLVKLHKQTCDRRYYPMLLIRSCHSLIMVITQAKQAIVLQSRPPLSYRLQTNWLFAAPVQPVRSPSLLPQLAPCR